MDHIRDKVVIVTGASSGIGLATANAFAGHGARVVLAARSIDKLDAAVTHIAGNNGTAVAVPTDVTVEADIVALFAETDRLYGRVDILVNVAGAADHTPIDELSLATWQHLLDLNLTSAMLCSREAFRRMKGQGSGRIINVGSASASRPRPNNAAYAATKFGLVGLTHSLAIDGREFGITASVTHPGVTQSNLMGDSAQEVGPTMMSAEDVARIILMHADLPDDMNLFESLALPIGMPFLGRG
jgi:NAD(P)-dependent dehydrogenase (short-subunit alcohol dehydrogenase family)